MLKTLRFILSHPLNRGRSVRAVSRYLSWQLRSSIKREIVFKWVGKCQLVVRKGMTGATGNIYCGLHEFSDMGFLIHILRPGELFIDVGANVGSYTVLAGALCGACVVAFEPDPDTAAFLRQNVEINCMEDRVEVHGIALGRASGTASFTRGLDTTNQVVVDGLKDTRQVAMRPLDDVLVGRNPVLMKLDVEGYEREVLAGAMATLQSSSLIAIETECNSPEVAEALGRAGFFETHYDPFTRSFSSTPRVSAANALFVRDLVACSERVATAPYRSIHGKRV